MKCCNVLLVVCVVCIVHMRSVSAEVLYPQYEKRTAELLESSDKDERRLAVKRILNLGTANSSHYEYMANTVAFFYNDDSVHSRDEIRLMIRALGEHGDRSYIWSLEKALGAKSGRTRGYAKGSIAALNASFNDGPVIPKTIIKQQINWIRSGESDQMINALTKFSHSKIQSEKILTELAVILAEISPEVKKHDVGTASALMLITKLLGASSDARYQPFLLEAWNSTELRKLKAYCKAAYRNIEVNKSKLGVGTK